MTNNNRPISGRGISSWRRRIQEFQDGQRSEPANTNVPVLSAQHNSFVDQGGSLLTRNGVGIDGGLAGAPTRSRQPPPAALPVAALFAAGDRDSSEPTNAYSPLKRSPSPGLGPFGSPTSPSGHTVPRFDRRGYPIKDEQSLKVASGDGTPRLSPGASPRPPSLASSTSSRDSSRVSKYSRYPEAYPPVARQDTDRTSLDEKRGIPAFNANHASFQSSVYPSSLAEYQAVTEGGQSHGSPRVAESVYHGSEKSVDYVGMSSIGMAESSVTLPFSDRSSMAIRGWPAGPGIVAEPQPVPQTRRGELYSLYIDPSSLLYMGPEDDDDLHNPDVHGKQTGIMGSLLTARGLANVGCVVLLMSVLVVLFAGYPIIAWGHHEAAPPGSAGWWNLGGINASGQVGDVGIGRFDPIDPDTPEWAKYHTSFETGKEWQLVFSDEFKTEGRTFYDGDDPYWQAEDLHYWATSNLEWYDPSMITTKNDDLVITLTNRTTNGRNFTGGMMTSWNRFCFTGGYIETSVSLPGKSNVYGLWPAIWTMGQLGRAGYGGSLDGLWPYSYDSCDVGTLKNQTGPDGNPKITLTAGDPYHDDHLSYLPGQRLSACTCPNDPLHPGPKRSDGTFVGRGAPEIDVFEAIVDADDLMGYVSQSAQWAPFNAHYEWHNVSAKDFSIYDNKTTKINPYNGGVFQQASSGLARTNQNCYMKSGGCYSVYGFEYMPGRDNGYITWVNDNKTSWTVRAPALQGDKDAMISQRIFSEEPMYMIVNLGLSENFGGIDLEGLLPMWPVEMHVDYIRVYQDPDNINVSCDPPNMPTAKYIDKIKPAYYNPNITTWDQVLENVPDVATVKNRLTDTC